MYQSKNVIASLVLLSSFSACSSPDAGLATYLDLVSKIQNKWTEVQKQVEQCDKTQANVSKPKLELCDLNERSIKGLFYIHSKNNNLCSLKKQNELLVLLGKERNYRTQLSDISKIELQRHITNESAKIIDDAHYFLPIISSSSYDLEQEFYALPTEEQKKLLNCNELKSNFNIESAMSILEAPSN